MQHHAYGIYGELTGALSRAVEFIEETYDITSDGNPDFEISKYNVFSVENARALRARAVLVPLVGYTKVYIIVIKRIYSEAQNAILKLLEEPPLGVIVVIVIAHSTMLLPTVLSRLATISFNEASVAKALIEDADTAKVTEVAHIFLRDNQLQRIACIKKAFTGNPVKQHFLRGNSILVLDSIERLVYEAYENTSNTVLRESLWRGLEDIETVRQYLYEKTTQARMLFEHLALTLPVIDA